MQQGSRSRARKATTSPSLGVTRSNSSGDTTPVQSLSACSDSPSVQAVAILDESAKLGRQFGVLYSCWAPPVDLFRRPCPEPQDIQDRFKNNHTMELGVACDLYRHIHTYLHPYMKDPAFSSKVRRCCFNLSVMIILCAHSSSKPLTKIELTTFIGYPNRHQRSLERMRAFLKEATIVEACRHLKLT